MSKKSNNDLMNGLGKLVQDSQDRKDNNVGRIILNTHITPEYTEKQSILIRVSDLYCSPKKWNFYARLDDNKKLELMNSIYENGILSPIIVWEVEYEDVESEYGEDEIDEYGFDGNKYLVLAGHNRVDAFNKLYETTNDERYLRIPAFIFTKDELDLESAKEIVIDSNYVQRVLSTKEKVKSVMYKYAEIEKNKTKKGRTRELVADELGMSSATVTQYLKLSTLIEEFQQLVYEEKLNLTSVLKIADKTKDTQKWVYDTYCDVLTSKMMNKIKPSMKRSDIETLFEKELQPSIRTKKITLEIPDELESKVREMVKNLIYREKNKE